ncbi:MAG: RDD family protein [Erythrobacteraceae bacterium]|jgi:uncharacterized RDD family membrane protein YckC|nr:RDD family protein [Erythrobacteraceae bacterium]
MNYAGFWIRVVAYIIDLLPLIVIGIALALLFGDPLVDTDPSPTFGASDLLGLVIGIAYFVGFESSSWQATPGKRALGLIVTDAEGRRISPARALGRYFGKILSGLILLIGYIMIAFTERKQGLHDFLAGTLVIKGQSGDVGYDPTVFD